MVRIIPILIGLIVVVSLMVLVGLIIIVGIKEGWFLTAKNKGAGFNAPCRDTAECNSIYKLGSSWICDPTIQQCRRRAYESGEGCQTTNDCIPITPDCVKNGNVRFCQQSPYHAGNLYGDPKGGCKGNTNEDSVLGLCRMNYGGGCKNTNDCLHGSCITGTCTYLEPLDKCDLLSYAQDQCGPSLTCIPDTPNFKFGGAHCQATGKPDGSAGSYCKTNQECDPSTKNCYKNSPSDPYGVCAIGVAFLGMNCNTNSDCVQSLQCIVKELKVGGTCQFLDPSVQTDLTKCPPQPYTAVVPAPGAGCSSARGPVPCVDDATCNAGCTRPDADALDKLVMGSISSGQVWYQLYPAIPGNPDTLNFFRNRFSIPADNTLTINSGLEMFVSMSMFPPPNIANIYPVINLTDDTKNPPIVGDLRPCTPLEQNELNLASLFANKSTQETIAIVKYDSSNAAASYVELLFTSPVLNGGAAKLVTINSSDLYTYTITDQNNPTNGKIYIPYNFQGHTDSTPYSMSAGDLSDIPLPWQLTPTTVKQIYMVPPPTSLYWTDKLGDYLKDTLRIPQNAPYTPEVFSHFFYYKNLGESVDWYKFDFHSMIEGGGHNTLIGYYSVSTPNGRKLITSTASFYIEDSALESSYVFNLRSQNQNVTGYGYRQKIWNDTGSTLALYCNVYSFVLLDFNPSIAWPFTATLSGPGSTGGDISGTCTISVVNKAEGIATFSELVRDDALTPGYNGTYPVFSPRAYCRGQVASSFYTSSWTNVFGTANPSILDVDTAAIARAGYNCIVGLVISVRSEAFDGGRYYPLFLTLRYGDTLTSNLYSGSNVTDPNMFFTTRMFTFWLTPEVEETGGEGFKNPDLATYPKVPADINSWITPGQSTDGSTITHAARSVWASEVFTCSIIPRFLAPPLRILRAPSTDPQDPLDIYVWGFDPGNLTDIIFVPLYANKQGTIISTDIKSQTRWVSSATHCAPTLAQIIDGMAISYFDKTTNKDWRPTMWDILPNAIIRKTGSIVPVLLDTRMCETQGYQDGLSYKARLYSFPEPGNDILPQTVENILNADCEVELADIPSTALCLCSGLSPKAYYQDVVRNISISDPFTMTNSVFVHPKIEKIYDNTKQTIVWISSDGSTTPLPAGAYRTTSCGPNPNSSPIIGGSSYPQQCPDYPLTSKQTQSDRRTPPVAIAYSDNTTGEQTVVVYDFILNRENGTVIFYENKIVTNDSQARNSYPGMSGGPVLVYSPCSV